MVYRTLNMFANRNALLVGLVWVPAKYADAFFAKKNEMSREKNLNPMVTPHEDDEYPELVRPTYFENNEFTSIFQTVIDTYGTPLYQEANPAIFTCVTFPFLFGVMFGDLCHGTMLFIFASYVIFFGKPGG